MGDLRLPWTNGPLPSEPTTIEGDEAHYLRRVHRADVGELIVLFDGQGQQLHARITHIGKHAVSITPLTGPRQQAPQSQLTIAVVPPKGERADWLVEKLTELGVQSVIWLESARSVGAPSLSKQQRWQRLAAQAARQAGSDWLPSFQPPTPLLTWLEDSSRPAESHCWYANPGGLAPQAWLPSLPPEPIPMIFVIGPEGGFTGQEQQAMAQAGFRCAQLSTTILRIETAAVFVASVVMAHRPARAP